MKFSSIIALLSVVLISQANLTLAVTPSLEQEENAKQEGDYRFSHSFYSEGKKVNAISFSPDGKFLSVGVDERVEIWDFETRTGVWELQGYSAKSFLKAHALKGTALSEDGQYEATLSRSEGASYLTIRRVADGKVINTLCPKRSYYAVAFSPDGRSLVLPNSSGTEGVGTVGVWTLAPFLNSQLPKNPSFNGRTVDYNSDKK